MGLTGFLAVTGIAFAIGRPVVKAMGDDSAFASAFYVPLTEEVLKALPAVLILVFAARRQRTRPSAIEMALLGAVLGAGFALYEDTQYHRGGFNFAAMPIASLVQPDRGRRQLAGSTSPTSAPGTSSTRRSSCSAWRSGALPPPVPVGEVRDSADVRRRAASNTARRTTRGSSRSARATQRCSM